MKIKVYGGTSESGNLCDRCSRCAKVQGQRESDQIYQCSILGRMKFPVATCTRFEERAPEILSRYSRDALRLYFSQETQRLMIDTGFFAPDLTIDQWLAQRLEKQHGIDAAPESKKVQ